MDFKNPKLHKILFKALRIALIISGIFSIQSIFFFMPMKPMEIILAIISSFIFSILLIGLPIAFIYFCIAVINEFVKSEFKTKKTLLKILAVNFLPATILLFLITLPAIFNLDTTFGAFAEISYILGIPCFVFLFISIPLSIIFLISAIVEDLTKKLKK